MTPALHPITGTGATEGPWLRAGNTVYALTETGGWRNGKPEMCNRFTAFVQPGTSCRPGEPEATAQLMTAAPDLRDALINTVALLELLCGNTDDYANTVITPARSALLRAQAVETGEGR